MSSEKKRIDLESKYRDKNSSYRSSIPRWVDMATFKEGYEGYQYTDHWGQLSLKYAPSYYKNEHLTKDVQSMAYSSSTMNSDLSSNEIIRGRQRRKIAFILVVVSLLTIAAIIIPVLVVFLTTADTQPEKFMVATMNLTVIETFRDEYNNKSSPEYKSFEQNFTNAMDQIYRNSSITGYNGIQIQSLRNGSIIVTFIIVIAVKRAEESPGEQVLKAVIIQQPRDKSDNTIVVVNYIKIRTESVSVSLIEYVKVNPITPVATTTLAITTPTLTPSTQAKTTTTPNTTATPTSTSLPTPTSTPLSANTSTTTTKATSTAATTITTKGTTPANTTLSSTSESSTTSTTKSDSTTTRQTTITSSTSSSTTSITASTQTSTTSPTSTGSTLSTPTGLNTTSTTPLTRTTITSTPTPETNTTSAKTWITTTATQPETNSTHYSTILSSTTDSNTYTTPKSTPTTTTQTEVTRSTSSSSSSTTTITTSTPTITTRVTSTGSTLSTPPQQSTTYTTTSTSTTTQQSTPRTTSVPTTISSSESTPKPNTTSTATSNSTTTTQPSSTSTTHSSTILQSTPEINTTTAEATMNLAIDENFNPGYANSSSSEYKSFVKNFTTAMDQIFMTSNITGYKEIQIQELRNGSIIVIFVIIFEIKQGGKPPQAEALVAIITQQPTDPFDTSIVVILNMRIRKASVTVVIIVVRTSIPITTSTITMTKSTRAYTTPTTTTTTVTSQTSATMPETSMMINGIPTVTTTDISSTSSIQDTTTTSTTLTTSITTQQTENYVTTSPTVSISISTQTTNTGPDSTGRTFSTPPQMSNPSTTAFTPTTTTHPSTTRYTSATTPDTTSTTTSTTTQPSTAEATMNLTLDENFKPGYANSSSSEYKSFVQNFTTAMDQIFMTNNITGYNGIQIQELRNGSIIVIFVIIFEVKQEGKPPQAEVLVAIITQQPTDQVDTAIVVISNMRIRKASVTVVKIVVQTPIPITMLTDARTTSTRSYTTTTTTTTPATSQTSATMPESSMMTAGIPAVTTTDISSTSSIQDTTTTSTTLTPSIPKQPTTSTTLVSAVAFSKDIYTSMIGTPLQLTCMVTGWNGNLNISRVSKLSQTEVNVVSLVNNENISIRSGIAVNETFSESNVDVFIFILNMTCDDEGTYYCKSLSASDSATVKRERKKPTLQLPDIMIRDEYHNVKYPFVCEAEVETPGEVVIAEVNRNLTYYTYEGYGESRQNITVDCVRKQILKFYINGKFTQDWDNTKIRCVVMNNLTNVENNILLVSDEKTIQLLPADICSGVADGSNITHPYSDCELFITCQLGVPVLGKCQQEQCFHDNIGMCRAHKCPFLYCRDTEVNIGDSASITCEILYCNDSFSLSVRHYEDIVFSNVNISGNISHKSEDKDIHISVSRGTAAVILTLNKTNCNHTGEYIIDLDRESFIDRATLRLKVPPKIPTLQVPQSIVAYTETAISCTGEQGVPQQDMYIEVMFNGSIFSKYDKTTLIRNSQNCSNMGTLVMTFLVEDMWDGARIRCVIGDNSSPRLESEIHDINITYTGVRFSSTKFNGLINGTAQMNCIVTGVFNGDNVIISRSNSGNMGEETLSNITVGNSTRSNLTGIQISTTNLPVNEIIVHVKIDSLQCHDSGTYYCKTGNRTATTSLEIWRKPDKPKLKLPLDVISDGYNQGGDPFVCEGNVGYPGGNLTVLFNKDGSFKEAQPFISKVITGNVTECGRVDKFEFYLNKFTTDLHNSTVRCVATNNNTLSNESAPYDDKVLLLVPGNTCYGATEGLILPYPYPFYDCGKYLSCSWNRTFVKDGGCKDGECFYTDRKLCEQERTTTTTKATTTTRAACPSITCLGVEPVINSDANITCALQFCGDEFDLAIELDSKVQFRETIRGNRTSSFLSNALLIIVVKDTTAELNIVFDNILCNQSGAYNVSMYGGNVSSVATLRVRVNPEKPNITAPSNIYKDQKTIISCIGQLGIPNALMFWQLKLPGGNFESYSVSGSPEIYKSDCSVVGNWTIGIYPEQSWNGGGIRCATKTQGNPSIEIYSDVIAIALKQPDIYFVPSSSSGYIGSSHSITCIARDMTNIMSVRIERQTASGFHEVASLAIDGTSATNFFGIRIRNTSSINSTAAAVYMDFDNLTCADKGDYFCTIGAFSSRGNLGVLRKPEVPEMVTFPTSGVLENTASELINCTGEVGYHDRKIVFESNKGGSNTFAPVPFSVTSTQMEGECSNKYFATFSYAFNMDWNSTVIRCKIDTEDVVGENGTSLYVDRKVLIIPGNICKTSNATYVPHPYACRQYVWCADRTYLQSCPGGLCHLAGPDNDTACDFSCSGCLDSF